MTLTTSLSGTPLLYWTKRCTFAKGNYRSSGGNYRQLEDKGSRNRRNYKTEGHRSRFIHDPREMALVGKSTAPLRGDGLSHGASEMDENQAPADVTLQDSKVRPKNPTFRRRVEDAAPRFDRENRLSSAEEFRPTLPTFMLCTSRAQLKFRNKRHGSLLQLQLHLGQASGGVKLFRVHLF